MRVFFCEFLQTSQIDPVIISAVTTFIYFIFNLYARQPNMTNFRLFGKACEEIPHFEHAYECGSFEIDCSVA